MAHVLLVPASSAKLVKRDLEAIGWLDKGFRMTKVETETSDSAVAVPVTSEAYPALQQEHASSESQREWMSQVLEFRYAVEVPFSTARFAAGKGQKTKG